MQDHEQLNGMNDAELVAIVAANMVQRLGQRTPDYLGDRAQMAFGMGDAASAQTWLDIAAIAARLLATEIASVPRISPDNGRQNGLAVPPMPYQTMEA